MNLLERLTLAGISLRLDGDRLVYRTRRGKIPGELLDELRTRRDDIMEVLRTHAAAVASRSDSPTADGAAPLSAGQRRLWFLQQLLPDAGTYNVPLAFRIDGMLNWHALEQAFSEIVRRHSILRTRYVATDSPARQVVEPVESVRITYADLSGLDLETSEALALTQARGDAAAPFDLSQGVLRMAALKVSTARHIVLFTVHHIAFDGWSVAILSREIAVLFRAYSEGKASPLSSLELQYADFARREAVSAGPRAIATRRYWQEKLAALPRASWPEPKQAKAGCAGRAANVDRILPQALVSGLHGLARQQGCTLFVVVCSALQVLLSHRSGEVDFAIGTDFARREQACSEDVIGFFANQIALRADLSQSPSFTEVVKRTRRTVEEAFMHCDLGYEAVLAGLGRSSELEDPLFRVKFVMQPEGDLPALEGLELAPLPMQTQSAKFDLLVNMFEHAGGFVCSVTFRESSMSVSEATHWLSAFEALLGFVLDRPSAEIAGMTGFLDAAERRAREDDRQRFRAVQASILEAPNSTDPGTSITWEQR